MLLLVAGCARHGASVAAPHVVTPAAVVAPPPVVTLEPEEEADETEWVTPCPVDSPEHKAARAALTSLSNDIDALPLTGDPAPLAKRLTDLVAETCFVGVSSAHELAQGTEFKSALSLKTFWHDGGHSALDSRLAWADPDAKNHWYWLGPSIRTALTTDNAPKTHPLYPLLCPGTIGNGPSAPGSCGIETSGWALRARSAFHAGALAGRFSSLQSHDDEHAPKSHATCSKAAKSSKPDRAFLVFSDCMLDTPVKEDALPLGTFRAPTSGWLLIRGRRGHYGWCNELRAYDLATGSAYIASLCGGMFVTSNTPPTIKVERGHLPVDALREAAWMMFLAPVTDHHVIPSGEGRAIPPELTLRIPTNRGFSLSIGGFGWSSGRTTLVYQWLRQGKSAATGTVAWPDADRPVDSHATELLAVAEHGYVRSCTGVAPLPASLPWSARSDKATRIGDHEGYFPDYNGAEFDDLERELARQAHGPCTP